MKKKGLLVSLFLSLALFLTGCIIQNNDIEIRADGTASVLSEMWIASEYADMLTPEEIPAEAEHSQETIDGVLYEKYVQSLTYATLDEFVQALTADSSDTNPSATAVVTTDTFEWYPQNSDTAGMTPEELESMESMMRVEYTLTMPSEIVYTNGVVDPANPNKVKWDTAAVYSGIPLRAYCEGSTQYQAFLNKAPVITGAKNNQYYKTSVTLLVTDEKGLNSVSLNGVNQSAAKIKNGISVTKDGKYTLKATNTSGKVSQITFYVDKTAPSIKGAKNNTTYKKAVTLTVSDKQALKSVTVNGKSQSSSKIKNGIKLSKNGTYKIVAADKAGNKTTITFKIKK